MSLLFLHPRGHHDGFGDILMRVWRIIVTHTHAVELVRILKQQLQHVYKTQVCYVGRMTQLISTLSGFVDGIGVTLSSKEELLGIFSARSKELRGLLRENNIPEAEWETWMQGL